MSSSSFEKLFTREEVAKLAHSTNGPQLLVIDNVVYDVSRFAYEHPGGKMMIDSYVGKDATSAYVSVHSASSASRAYAILKSLRVGRVVDADVIPDPLANRAKR